MTGGDRDPLLDSVGAKRKDERPNWEPIITKTRFGMCYGGGMAKAKEYVRELRPHAIWRILEATLLTSGVALWQYLRTHLDFALIAIVFVGSLIVFLLGSLRRPSESAIRSNPAIGERSGDGDPGCGNAAVKNSLVGDMRYAPTLERWEQLKRDMQLVQNRQFSNEENLRLDGRSFVGCSFTNCDLIYSGTAPARLFDCTLDERTRARFKATDPAITHYAELRSVIDVELSRELQIISAYYGTGGMSYKDVTATLRKLVVKPDSLYFQGTPGSYNVSFGPDPYLNKLKHLKVTYTFSPKNEIIFKEDSDIVLPPHR